jgi:hypothetical protein
MQRGAHQSDMPEGEGACCFFSPAASWQSSFKILPKILEADADDSPAASPRQHRHSAPGEVHSSSLQAALRRSASDGLLLDLDPGNDDAATLLKEIRSPPTTRPNTRTDQRSRRHSMLSKLKSLVLPRPKSTGDLADACIYVCTTSRMMHFSSNGNDASIIDMF